MDVTVLVLLDMVALPLGYLMIEAFSNVVRPLSECHLPICTANEAKLDNVHGVHAIDSFCTTWGFSSAADRNFDNGRADYGI